MFVSSSPLAHAAPPPRAAAPYRHAIWLLSDGRSGSTWFAGLLNFHGRFHVEHEPIHAQHTPLLAGAPLMPLPCDAGGVQAQVIGEVLARGYAGARFGAPAALDREGVVIRDIHALLIAPRLLRAYPALRPVVLVRHPAEVAASKCALAQWRWFEDVAGFLGDPELAGFLGARARHVLAADTPFERYVVHWAVTHAWFFAHTDGVPVVRYPAAIEANAAAVRTLPGGIDAAADRPEFAAAHAQRSLTDRPPAARRLLPRRRCPGRAERRFAEAMIDAFGLRWLVEGRC